MSQTVKISMLGSITGFSTTLKTNPSRAIALSYGIIMYRQNVSFIETKREKEMKNADSFQALEKLPAKLADQLMPFQKDGIRYALEKNGRFATILKQSTLF